MFRGYMPALTLLVFGIGVGIGGAWSQGLIPLTFVPARSGSLSVDALQREELPPPNDPVFAHHPHRTASRQEKPDDPEVFELQSEPEFAPPSIAQTAATKEAIPNHLASSVASYSTEPDDFAEDKHAAELAPPETPRVRVRNQAAVQLDPQAGIEAAPPAAHDRRVKVVAHQDPTESASDAIEQAREPKAQASSPRELLAAAEEKLAAGETLAAHREFSKLYWNHKELRPQLQETIDSTAKAIFFQTRPHYVEPYVIQEGERLEVIAKKYQLSWEYLAKLNRTDPKRIQIGQKLKVMKGPFGAVVDLPEFALVVHLQGYYVKRYQVGIGKDGASPIGKFAVLNKVENPPYTGPNGKVIAANDPSNPLGERWVDLGDSYGIHGTIDPNSIGKAESRGCIRLRDNDVIEVYDFLVKGSEVVIRK